MTEEKKGNRGGARERAGRPKKEQAKTVTVAFSCTMEQKQLIAKCAGKLGVSKSEFICKKLFS